MNKRRFKIGSQSVSITSTIRTNPISCREHKYALCCGAGHHISTLCAQKTLAEQNILTVLIS